jgi:hypothetical protein
MGHDVGEGLFTKLTGDTDISNLVGTRVYPSIAPQNATTPFIIYNETAQTFNNAMRVDPNISEPRYQVSSYSTSYSGSRTLSKFVKDNLRDFSGAMGPSSEPITVQRIFMEFEMDMTHRDLETFEVMYHVIQDYKIWYSSS